MTIKERTLILIIILQGCATPTPGPGSVFGKTILIETKAQIKDLKKDESHNVKIEIILLNQQAIRMEISALFGFPIASIIMTPRLIQYALHTSKEYVEGPFSAKTLYPIFKQNIDPRILWNVIHNRSPDSSDLKCFKDSALRPIYCKGLFGIRVDWAYDANDKLKKRIEIKNPQFEMIWVFKGQSPLDSAQNETFVLKKPDGYQEIRLK